MTNNQPNSRRIAAARFALYQFFALALVVFAVVMMLAAAIDRMPGGQ